MTKKDYILIAKYLKDKLEEVAELHYSDSFELGFSEAIGCLATALEEDNPRFDRHAFSKAVTGE